MKWMVDTNVISHLMRGTTEVVERWRRILAADILIPAVVVGEGLAGAYRVDTDRYRRVWAELARDYPVVVFGLAAADRYGRLRADLERRGRMIGHRDCQIASTALAWHDIHPGEEVTLVTGNVKEFSRVPELAVTDWAEG